MITEGTGVLLSIQVSFPQQGCKLLVAGDVAEYRGELLWGSQARGRVWSLKALF